MVFITSSTFSSTRRLPFNRLVILYGSETGNAQDLSKIVAWTISGKIRCLFRDDVQTQEKLFEILYQPMDEYTIECLPSEQLVLFICSTTGIGEEPQNMRRFWRFLLRRDLPSNSLQQLNFGVIGLGDSSYQKYNFVAKKLHKRLLNLGANPLLELALGDDQHELGPYVKIDPWLEEFYKLIFGTDFSEIDEDETKTMVIQSSVRFNSVGIDDQLEVVQHDQDEIDAQTTFDALHPYIATVAHNIRVTSDDHFQDVRFLSLSVHEPFHYRLGDVCSIYPENSDEDVEAFLNIFTDSDDAKTREDYCPDRLIYVEFSDDNSSAFIRTIPNTSYYHHLMAQTRQKPISVFTFIKRYLDICSIPKRSFFYLFHRFSRNDLEQSMLQRFALGTDLDELYDYVNRPKRTILEVMADFPHTAKYVPFEYLLDLIPAITARPYSIANSPVVSPDRIELLYAVVNYRTRLRKPRKGLCTSWLATSVAGQQVRIFVRPSSFQLSKDIHGDNCPPLIMVAAGTGVAPFRAFIHHRTATTVSSDSNSASALSPVHTNNYLFFGCRYRNKDYFFEEEWRKLITNGHLIVVEAFSRNETTPDRSKIYVQHRLWQQRELVARLLMQQDARLWIAGKSQQYPQLVRETIVKILIDYFSNQTVVENQNAVVDDVNIKVEKLVAKLEANKRIIFECW